jgi:hypothetical protein
MIGLIAPRLQVYLNTRYRYSAHFQFAVAQALAFSVFTSRLLATDLSTETNTSNHYEVFLLFLVRSPWTSELN